MHVHIYAYIHTNFYSIKCAQDTDCKMVMYALTHTYTSDGEHTRRFHRGGRMSGKIQEAVAAGVPREGRVCAHHRLKVLQRPTLLWRRFRKCCVCMVEDDA
jgi:hypothetical protein